MNSKTQNENSRTDVKECYQHSDRSSGHEVPEYWSLDERQMMQSGIEQPRPNKLNQKEHNNNMNMPQPSGQQNRGVCLKLVIPLLAVVVILACLLVPTIILLRRVEMTLDEQQERYLEPVTPALRFLRNSSKTCYCLYTEKRSWFQARDFCHFRRGVAHLAEILDEDTNFFLRSLLRAFKPDAAVWLGASDLEKEGEFLWDTSRMPLGFSTWDHLEPSGHYKNIKEDCLDIFNYKTHAFLWNDDDCYALKNFLCQSPLTADRQCDC